MHDPEVVVFDVHLPIPWLRKKWEREPDWGIRVHRFTNPEHLGKRIEPWFRPKGYDVFVAGRKVELVDLCTVWHTEPDGRDAGSKCKGMKGSDLNWHNVKWAFKHRHHLEAHFDFYRRVKRWRNDRCEECGKPFRWKGDSRSGYMSSDKVWHDKCLSLVHVRSQLEDAAKVLTGTADFNERFRVDYWLRRREGQATSSKLPAPLPEIEERLRYYNRTTDCHSGSDGDCAWPECPQLRDDEPHRSGRHCPLDVGGDGV